MFSRQYPQLCHLKEKNKYGGVEYLIDKSRLSIHFQEGVKFSVSMGKILL